MLAEERREQFKADVAQMKLKTGTSRRDGLYQAVGGVVMLAGAIASFLLYEASLSDKDPRNIASKQVLVLAFVVVTIIGAALFVVGSIAKVLRLWLLRQLYEGQAHVDQLAAAVRER
jgi:ABC-type transport system involved in cytochrome c biogenesis permease subunit